MTGQLRVGIAGYGIVGKRRRQFIDLHPRMKTVAVCDRTFDGNGVFADGIRYYTTFQDLLRDELDVLFVCLTNDVAPDVTIAGLRSGLHVFCEKPPGRTASDVERVIGAEQEQRGLKLKYGFNHRYHDSVREALRIIRRHELGDVINLRGVYGKSAIITFQQSDWRSRRELAGGGVLLDQGIHMVDMMRLFAGD
ncbi:MAG: Gfo/Idh/MocA family oxidoreductase, partial [Acidobacteriota bacterium]